MEPRSTPRVLGAKVWRALPSLAVTAAAPQSPPQALRGSPGLREVEPAAGGVAARIGGLSVVEDVPSSLVTRW